MLLASTEGAFEQNVKGVRIKAKKSRVGKLNETKALILQILDVIKDFKTIPDAEPENVLRVLNSYINKALNSSAKISEAERLAMEYYRPSVQALLGAIMENALDYKSEKLEGNLNRLSKYNMGVSSEILSNAEKWRLQ